MCLPPHPILPSSLLYLFSFISSHFSFSPFQLPLIISFSLKPLFSYLLYFLILISSSFVYPLSLSSFSFHPLLFLLPILSTFSLFPLLSHFLIPFYCCLYLPPSPLLSFSPFFLTLFLLPGREPTSGFRKPLVGWHSGRGTVNWPCRYSESIQTEHSRCTIPQTPIVWR